MPRIPFIEARLDLPNQSVDEIQSLLCHFLRKLREAAWRKDNPDPEPVGDPLDIDYEPAPLPTSVYILEPRDHERIERRAKELVRRRKQLDRLGHLRREDRERLSVLKDGVELAAIPSEHRADELASELHAEMPWMAPATEVVWHAMRRATKSDDGILRIPPLILDGPPGIGKSVWARRLAGLLGVPSSIVEATNENAGFSVAGLQRGWGTATPGKPLETILRTRVGNPIIVIDEIEKTGRVHSRDGSSHGLTEALLPLLETASSRHWECPYFRVPFDMSWISRILTSNQQALLPEPFLSRCRVVHLPELDIDHLVGFAEREAARRGLSAPARGALIEAIYRSAASKRRLSLRAVLRLLDRAETLQQRPPLH